MKQLGITTVALSTLVCIFYSQSQHRGNLRNFRQLQSMSSWLWCGGGPTDSRSLTSPSASSGSFRLSSSQSLWASTLGALTSMKRQLEWVCFLKYSPSVSVFTLLQQFWCWIGDGSRYNAERLAGQYFWMWASLAISAFVYIALFFSFRGHLTVSSDHWWRVEFHRQRDIQIVDPDGQKRRSIRMVLYVTSSLFLESRLTFLLVSHLWSAIPSRILYSSFLTVPSAG